MGSLDYFVQQTMNAFSLGSIYALVAIGLAMVFGILRLINFAHGDLMMVACYIAFFLTTTGLSFIPVLVIAILATTVLGILMERVAYRPVRGAPDVIMLLTSLAVSMFIENVFIMFLSPVPRTFRGVTPKALDIVNHWGPVNISNINLITIGITAVLFGFLYFFVKRTQLGISMRATSEDLMAAQLVGINIDRVIVTAFVLGSSLAGIAGILWAARLGKIDPLMGFIPLLKAFVAAVIGGFGDLAGAVLGAYVLGFAEIFLIGFLPPVLSSYRDAFVFLILIIVLLIRPNGILGSTEKEKV
ncbi:MAG: branched-chain amino acid ABC transporter permease [Anaerolineales bacterium]